MSGPRTPPAQAVQHREGQHHAVVGGKRQAHEADAVAEHATHAQQALVVAVSEPAAKQLTSDLEDRHQRDDEAGRQRRERHALGEVRQQMGHHRRHRQEREAMADRDAPEGAGTHRLLGREVDVRGNSPVRCGRMWRGGAVGHLAYVVRAVMHKLHERQAHQQHDEAGDQRRPAPAQGLQRHDDDGHAKAADGKTELRDSDSFRPVAIEPVDDGNGERGEAAQAGADCDQRPSEIVSEHRVHQSEQPKPGGEDDEADAQDQAWPKAIHQPALQRAEQSGFYPR